MIAKVSSFLWGRIAVCNIVKKRGSGGTLPREIYTFWTSEMLFFGILLGSLHYYRCRHCKNLKATFWRPSQYVFAWPPLKAFFFFCTAHFKPHQHSLALERGIEVLLFFFFTKHSSVTWRRCAHATGCVGELQVYTSFRLDVVGFFSSKQLPHHGA